MASGPRVGGTRGWDRDEVGTSCAPGRSPSCGRGWLLAPPPDGRGQRRAARSIGSVPFVMLTSLAPSTPAPSVPFTSPDVRLVPGYFRSPSGSSARASAKRCSRPMQADGHRVRRDPQDLSDGLVPELLPGDQTQDLLVGRRQRRQGARTPAHPGPRRRGAGSGRRPREATRSVVRAGRGRDDGWPGRAVRRHTATAGLRRGIASSFFQAIANVSAAMSSASASDGARRIA